MKTSPQQFDMMLTYMEEHGDLSKPSTNAKGRVVAIQRWDALTSMLNSDGSDDTRTSEKWKKVWSDFKNNAKKKAARLHRAASGTGGGPAVYAKLTDFEQRALGIIGVQAATGLTCVEAGFPQEIQMSNVPATDTVQTPEIILDVYITQETGIDIDINEPGPSSLIEPVEIDYLMQGEHTNMPSTSAPAAAVPYPSPVHEEESEHRLNISQSRQSTPRRDRRTLFSPRGARRARHSPRRPVRPTRTEQAAQNFVHSDNEWREFRKEQHADYMQMKREQNRIREMELVVQREWQALGLRVLDIVDKYLSR